MKSTNHRRLASHNGGVCKNVSFGSRWANKVKINAYSKKIKVVFDLACMLTCCWGLSKPKYKPFITHNRGTLNSAYYTVYPVYCSPFLNVLYVNQYVVFNDNGLFKLYCSMLQCCDMTLQFYISVRHYHLRTKYSKFAFLIQFRIKRS